MMFSNVVRIQVVTERGCAIHILFTFSYCAMGRNTDTQTNDVQTCNWFISVISLIYKG